MLLDEMDAPRSVVLCPAGDSRCRGESWFTSDSQRRHRHSLQGPKLPCGAIGTSLPSSQTRQRLPRPIQVPGKLKMQTPSGSNPAIKQPPTHQRHVPEIPVLPVQLPHGGSFRAGDITQRCGHRRTADAQI